MENLRGEIERVNQNPQAYLERDRSGKGFVCPVCKSGTGKNGTGMTTRDGRRFTCWSGRCFTSSSVFDILAVSLGIDPKAMKKEDYERVLGRVGAPSREKKRETSAASYLEACRARVAHTDYFQKRGLSAKTVEAAGLGYDPAFKTRLGDDYVIWDAVVIPTGENSYVVRNTKSQSSDDRIRKRGEARLWGEESLYGGEEPLFLVEGEFDALSIREAGADAVSLGSVANVEKLLKRLSERPVRRMIILSLDNDEAGESASVTLWEGLSALDIPCEMWNVQGAYNDPNEALVNDREAFLSEVRAALEGAAARREAAAEDERARRRSEYIQRHAAVNQLPDFLAKIRAGEESDRIPTGFPQLDAMLDGGLYPGLYILGAVSSLGKTSFAMQLCDQAAEKGRDVLIFSLEMARSELMAKSLSRLSFLYASKPAYAKTTRGVLRGDANYLPGERELIDTAAKHYAQYADHLYILEGMGDVGARHVRESVERHIELTGERPLVVIDYLQLLMPEELRATDKQNTDRGVLELKRVSRDFRVPVLAISSFNRENYKMRVNMSAFKESGVIEYSSDVLIGLQAKGAGGEDFDPDAARQRDPREVELVLLKNRNGPTGGKIDLLYRPMFNWFAEVSAREVKKV